MSETLAALANDLMKIARDKRLTLITAESCTAGLLCQVLSDAEGAAELFHGGFVTYTKRHKQCALDVPWELLRKQGAVCPAVAGAMAEGALRHSEAVLSASITGVAGPEPDADGNPVGRVCFAVARRCSAARCFECHYGNAGRETIREMAVADALRALIQAAVET
jgi:nicotinamide-nucleotide amidase